MLSVNGQCSESKSVVSVFALLVYIIIEAFLFSYSNSRVHYYILLFFNCLNRDLAGFCTCTWLASKDLPMRNDDDECLVTLFGLNIVKETWKKVMLLKCRMVGTLKIID